MAAEATARVNEEEKRTEPKRSHVGAKFDNALAPIGTVP
jgi:hypothetical protein